ncbi:hypothetical protein [Roseibium aggregatum]|uniref:hypothetical protein n=1 Tax=Roseibium aggregatum TaxID=187304 RepID=UPI003A96C62D
MKPQFWVIQGILGFLICFAITSGALIALLVIVSEIFNSRFVPRGLGWFVVPVLGGWFGWKFGTQVGIESVLGRIQIEQRLANRLTRIWVAGSSLWLVSSAFYLLVGEPYGSYVSDDEYIHFFSVVLGVVAIFGFGIFMAAWALKEN